MSIFIQVVFSTKETNFQIFSLCKFCVKSQFFDALFQVNLKFWNQISFKKPSDKILKKRLKPRNLAEKVNPILRFIAELWVKFRSSKTKSLKVCCSSTENLYKNRYVYQPGLFSLLYKHTKHEHQSFFN